VRNHRDHLMSRLLRVSTSGYYKRADRSTTTASTDREQRKGRPDVKIIGHHRESGGTYGWARITAACVPPSSGSLRKDGRQDHGRDRAGRDQPAHVQGARHFVDPTASFPPDVVERRFDQGRPDAVWSSDITFLSLPSTCTVLSNLLHDGRRRGCVA